MGSFTRAPCINDAAFLLIIAMILQSVLFVPQCLSLCVAEVLLL